MQPFQLLSLPVDKNKARVFLLQFPLKTSFVPVVAEPTTVARIEGASVDSVTELLIATLGSRERLDSFLNNLDGEALDVSEETAVRFVLVFSAVQNLRSEKRVEKIIQGIQAMDGRDLAFWFEKLNRKEVDDSGKPLGVDPKVVGSLRYFLTEEI